MINHYKTEFKNQYLEEEKKLLLKYAVNGKEVNCSLDKNFDNIIAQMVITKIVDILSNKIYFDYNSSILKFITDEIKNMKKSKEYVINIPNELINSIKKMSDDIYNNIGNISDNEDENKKSEEENKKKEEESNNKKIINYLINDDEED